MHNAEKQSLDYINGLIEANQAPPQLEARAARHRRGQIHGKVAAISCMDARVSIGSLDPGYGPVLSQMSGFAGHIPVSRSMYSIFGHSIISVIYGSHWDDTKPDNHTGFRGCGARDARQRMQNGELMHISAARYIDHHVNPHCIEGAVMQSLDTSRITNVPCYAIGMSHITQEPHLLAVSQNGRFQYQVDFETIRNASAQPIPEEIQKEHPVIMNMLQQGQIFARSQTPEEMQRRQVQDPLVVWVTGSHYPTWDVFGPSLGEIMRVGYYRDGNHKLRGGELAHIADHASYPFHMATHGDHGFSNTNALLIDGKKEEVYRNIWHNLRGATETQQWLRSGDRVIMGAVVRAGRVMSHERLD